MTQKFSTRTRYYVVKDVTGTAGAGPSRPPARKPELPGAQPAAEMAKRSSQSASGSRADLPAMGGEAAAARKEWMTVRVDEMRARTAAEKTRRAAAKAMADVARQERELEIRETVRLGVCGPARWRRRGVRVRRNGRDCERRCFVPSRERRSAFSANDGARDLTTAGLTSAVCVAPSLAPPCSLAVTSAGVRRQFSRREEEEEKRRKKKKKKTEPTNPACCR